jgi:hypothetical protein
LFPGKRRTELVTSIAHTGCFHQLNFSFIPTFLREEKQDTGSLSKYGYSTTLEHVPERKMKNGNSS